MKAIINCALLLTIFLSACNSEPKFSIAGCWNTKEITQGNVAAKQVAVGDNLCLNTDSSFSYVLQREMIYATGNWRLTKDSVLILNYDYLPGDFGVDSVAVKDSGLLVYYRGKRVVKRIGVSRNLTKDKDFAGIYEASKNISRTEREYTIEMLNENQLQFSEKGILFSYSKN
ncbi:hypothetical protein [Luteibaculum oceani]|uniref:Lipocalin family protein n=1 Tax=Luteibaculum oceani TaxID=1294296 RepID=A0A5C6V124_9FLAO|nr:hypothetical protein [Luteibaculum oceani]TXC78321.1 hypothetical protein FRX97_08305 [Luteibaculum oceani]